jgi:hypothetical protein
MGESSYTTSKITLHTLTAVKIAEMISKANFDVIGNIGEPGFILCRGSGFKNRYKK